MAATNVYGYLLTVKWGTKIIKGLETTGLKIDPKFEEILLKEHAGVPVEEFVDFDTEMGCGGKTIERDSGEATTHEDFETLREATAVGAVVAFVYGRTVTGEKQVTGTGTLRGWSEECGSEKKLGSFSFTIKAKKGTVTFGVQGV